MRNFILNQTLKKICTTYLMVAILVLNFPFQAYAALVTVDIQANGLNALTLANSSQSFDITITSANATSCLLTSPVNSGVALSDSIHVDPTNSFYPSVGGSTTFSVTCDDGTGVTASDTVVVNLSATPPPSPTIYTVTPVVTNGVSSPSAPQTVNSGNTVSFAFTPNAGYVLDSVSVNSATPGCGSGSNVYNPVTTVTTVTTGAITSDCTITATYSPDATPSPTIDVKVNGSDGPVTLTSPAAYTYTWVSTNSTCQMTSPITSGISTSGTSDSVAPGNAFYPTSGSPVTITVTCTDGTSTVSDSVVVNLAGTPPPPPSPTVDLVANPTTLLANATSTLSWTSTNATSCSAPWTVATTTSGSQIVTVATTTTYSITCTNGVTTVTDSAIVTVLTPGSCTLPIISSPLTASGTVNTPFSYTVTTTSTSTPSFSIGSSVLPTGLSFSTTTGIISGTPTQTGTFTIIITPTNPCGTDTQTLVLTINPAGGVTPPPVVSTGGGGSGGGHRRPIVTTTTTTSTGLECFYLRDYMRRDFNNDPIEVMKLQAFLLNFEGYSYVTVNGVFDQATFDAVSAFQMKYESDILTPWGHTAPTGYVYILTLKKVNEIYCQKIFPVNEQQQLEINAHRALLERLNAAGTPPVDNNEVGFNQATTTSPVEVPIIGQISPQGQNTDNVAAAIFAFPTDLQGFMQCMFEWLLILIVLYILGSVLKDVLYKDTPENVLKKFMTKWLTITIGLVIAIIIAYILYIWCIILPLLIALLISLVWMTLYPRHDSIKSSVKSWYIVLRARSKSAWLKLKNRLDPNKKS